MTSGPEAVTSATPTGDRQTPATAPVQDFTAAMHEFDSNVEVRRLMFVVTNVLTPACLMAVSDCLAGADYPAATAWLPRLVLPIAGALLVGNGIVVCFVLARCHFGLVLNSAKMQKVTQGSLRTSGLNWIGVTTSFVLLTSLSAGLGATFMLASVGLDIVVLPAALAIAALLMLWLPWNHARANRRCRVLDSDWQTGAVPRDLREQHVRRSVAATTADASVIVVMAVALFAGGFNALTNLGGIPASLPVVPTADVIKTAGFPLLAGYLSISLILSCTMIARLRGALAEHSLRLAELRNEMDDTARVFRFTERTFWLYLLVLLLAVASVVMFGWERGGKWWGLGTGAALLGFGMVAYPAILRRSLPR